MEPESIVNVSGSPQRELPLLLKRGMFDARSSSLQSLFSLQACQFNEQIRNARKIVACPLETPTPARNNHAFSYVRASRFVKEFTQIAQSAIKGPPRRKEGKGEQSAAQRMCASNITTPAGGKFRMIAKRSHRIEQFHSAHSLSSGIRMKEAASKV